MEAGWIDREGFERWRAKYEAAGILPAEDAPADLRVVAASAGLVVASDAPRALESAARLAPGREVTTSPLLRELELPAPRIGEGRWPLAVWALAFGVRWVARRVRGLPQHSGEEIARVAAAGDWLEDLARAHGSVVVATHHSFRSLLAKELARRGWLPAPGRRRMHHWSAWTLVRATRSSQLAARRMTGTAFRSPES